MRTLIASIEKRIIAQHRSDEASKRLRSIPGIGLVGATAIVATITDPKATRASTLHELRPPERFAETSDLLLQRGHRPYMAPSRQIVHCSDTSAIGG